MPSLRYDARAAALALALLAHVLLAFMLAQGSARLTWHAQESVQPGLLFLQRAVEAPQSPVASSKTTVMHRHAAAAPSNAGELVPSIAPAAPASAEPIGDAAASRTNGEGKAAAGSYGMELPDQRAGLAEQAGPAVPKEKWARFRRNVGSAYVPDCLHTDALKNQHTAEGDCQICVKGLAAAPAVAVAKLKGQCK